MTPSRCRNQRSGKRRPGGRIPTRSRLGSASPSALTAAVFLAGIAAMLAGLACSQTDKHAWLSFFFDGVPPLETKVATVSQPGPATEAIGPSQPPVPTRLFAHTPYRENRCGGCHDPGSGALVRPLGEGLCRTCHTQLVRDLAFLHGPVAVDDCTACHHYHTAPFANLLLAEPVATCLNCHDENDLRNDQYHATIAAQACTECHDPHGGADRFFLKRSTP